MKTLQSDLSILCMDKNWESSFNVSNFKPLPYECRSLESINRSSVTTNCDIGVKDMNMNEIIGLAWGAKEILRGDFKKNKWGEIILPFIVLRRLERVLEPTKEQVLQEYKKLEKYDEKLIQARLNLISKQHFHSRSQYNLDLLLADDKNIHSNMKQYLREFSKNVKDIFDNFKFNITIDELNKQKLLFQIVQNFAKAPLDPQTIDNHMMGTIYEELIRRTSEAGNEEAGDHFTPREVIKLIVNLLFSPDKNFLKQKHLIRTIYDPAAGTGGMLSIASDYVSALNPDAQLDSFGQELNQESYAICKSDMMLKGLDLNNIKLGNSLIRSKEEEDILGDGFPNEKFHYMLSNPPFGVDWRKYESEIRTEAENGFKGKYGPGLPRRSDGSLLFLLHMMSKMKSVEQGGSRIAIILNGSPLFTGEADSGESNIRKFIIENDMLEAIIALPDQLFYNTGIFTYIWIVTNNKEPRRRGKVQLINAVSFYEKMRISLGQKRNKVTDEHIIAITKIYEDFKENEYSKIFEDREFGYTRITIERPLKRNFQVTEERLARLKQESVFQKLAGSKIKPKQDDVIAILKAINSAEVFRDYKEFSKAVKNAFSQAKLMFSPQLENAIVNALSEHDDTAHPALDKNNKPIPDSGLRDYENVPLKEDIDKYFENEVRPYVPDAWIDNSTRDKIGYEIPITRHFYEYKPLRSVEEISADIKQLENEISDGLKEMIQ